MFSCFQSWSFVAGSVLKFCKIVVHRQISQILFSKYHILKIHSFSDWYLCVHEGATDVDQYVVVYNPLAWNITTFVTVSVSQSAVSVYDELGQSVPAQVLQLSLVSFHWLDPTSCQSVVIYSITVRTSISSSWDFPSLPSSDFFFLTYLFPQLEFFLS